MTPSPSTEFVVRPPQSDAETAAFFRLAAATFIRDTPAETAAADFRRYVRDAPGAGSAAVRGAFRGDEYLGGYLIEDRWLRIGAARVRTGCIGVVVVHPEQRGQGIGKALMRDAFAHARSRGQVILLLHGLADFYTPFGFADVFDATEHTLRRADVLNLPPSPHRVRPATPDDAPALVALYDRHYGPHPGSFARDAAQEAFRLRFAASLDRDAYRQRDNSAFAPPVVSVGKLGRVRGYLVAPWGPLRAFGSEVAADDWLATLALLQHQARAWDGSDSASETIRWPLPPDSLMASLLADHVTVESSATHRPRANWQACLVDPPALMEAMLPEWDRRWRRCAAELRGNLALSVDGATTTLRLASAGLSGGDEAEQETHVLALSSAVLLPLLFGFRTPAWAEARPGQRIPRALAPVLDILFPPVTPWIAPSDGC